MTNFVKTHPYIFCIVAILWFQHAAAQNTTSPYSILGIGDIETKDFGRWYGMGSTSIALSSPYFINASNPASLMAMEERVMNFDVANRGKSASFKYPSTDTFTARTKDFSIRRISLAFKVNKKWAFSFGLKPFTTINYLLAETNAVYTSSDLLKQVDGSGGLNQFYFSYARKINKNLNIGVTASYYFGSANILTQYYGQQLSLALDKQEYIVMNAVQFQAGMQYAAKISDHLTHRFGITISNPANIQRRTDVSYLNNTVSVKTTSDTDKDFKLPLSFGAGYAIVLNQTLTISADGVFNNWAKQSVEYPNSYTTPSGRLSAGVEYAHRKKINNYSFENWYVQAGASFEKNYISIQNNPLNSYSFTAGFGKNLSRAISIYGGYEYSTKGSNSYNQITEKASQYIIGFTLKEYWFNTRKLGRFQ